MAITKLLSPIPLKPGKSSTYSPPVAFQKKARLRILPLGGALLRRGFSCRPLQLVPL